MSAPIIDRDAIIEKAARAAFEQFEEAIFKDDPEYTRSRWGDADAENRAQWIAEQRMALDAIADDLLAPIEALHQPNPTLEYLPNSARIPWIACTCGFRTHSACPTAQAVAAIREAVRA